MVCAAVCAAPAAVSSPETLLPGCVDDDTAGYANGQLPSSALCELPGGVDERLRPAAARSFVALSAAYAQALGRPPCVIDGYRTLGEQQQLRRTRPRFAARPGVRDRVEAFAASERVCCAFLSLDVSAAEDEVVLTIDAPAGAEPVLAEMVAAFT